ncbi:MAG: hypothetical protein WC822_03915, partial [Candidatus Paceibacterota bacterium]
FKPEAGRAVYCRDCIAKIKSGELKPIAGTIRQIKQDETKFYKPLADLGIEFEQKDKNIGMEEIEGEDRYKEEKDKDQKEISHPKPSFTPKIFSSIKKVFTSNKEKIKEKPKGENLALREILNKTLNISNNKKEEVKQTVAEVPVVKPTPPPVSLDTLKNENEGKKLKDRSASAEDMNKLKSFIEVTNIPIPKKEPIKQDEKLEDIQTADKNSNIKTKEVPEDVLRKILE